MAVSAAGRKQENVMTGPGYRLAEYINSNWDWKVGMTNKEAAKILGYKGENMISMLRTGKSRVSLERLPDIARIMNTDIGALLPLWFDQYWGTRDDFAFIDKNVLTRFVTEEEQPLIVATRAAKRKNPAIKYDEPTLEAISKLLTSQPASLPAA